MTPSADLIPSQYSRSNLVPMHQTGHVDDQEHATFVFPKILVASIEAD